MTSGMTVADVVARFEAAARTGEAAALNVLPLLPETEEGVAWRLHLRGRLAHAAGRFAAAALLFRHAIALIPGEVSFHSLFGCVFRCTGRPDEAARHYRHAIRLRASHAPAWFYLGVVRFDAGGPDATAVFERALALAPARAEAWFRLGILRQEKKESSAACLGWAERVGTAAFEAAVWRLSPAVVTRNGLTAAFAHYRSWSRHSPVLSRMMASAGEGSVNRIELAARLSDWREGRLSPPPLHELYQTSLSDADERKAKRARVMIVAPRYIGNDRRFIECDITLNYAATAVSCGLTSAVAYSDGFTHRFQHRSEIERATALDELDQALGRFQPDLVLFEGGFLSSAETIGVEDWRRLKDRHGFRLATVISDFDESLDDYAGHWAPVSDLVIVFNPHCRRIDLLAASGKAFLAHGLPFDDRALFRPGGEPRLSDVVFVGSNVRLRSVWLSALADAGFRVDAHLHNRESSVAPPMDEYARLLGTGKATINNGILPSGGSIITGRVFEAMLSETVLLQEGARGVEDYFVPYVHFLPYETVGELVHWTRRVCADDGLRRALAQEARRWMLDRYSADRFWTALLARLFCSSRAAGQPPAASIRGTT